MADQKISALTIDSTPDRVADYVPTYDASAVTNKKVLLSLLGAYNMDVYFSLGLSPADATTYYFSTFPSFGLATALAAHKLWIPRTGKIIRIDIAGYCTTGSAETSTFSLRLNDTTDTTIDSTTVFNASPFVFTNSSLGIAVTAGDYVNVKWVTPTWVTNPTNVSMRAQIFIA